MSLVIAVLSLKPQSSKSKQHSKSRATIILKNDKSLFNNYLQISNKIYMVFENNEYYYTFRNFLTLVILNDTLIMLLKLFGFEERICYSQSSYINLKNRKVWSCQTVLIVCNKALLVYSCTNLQKRHKIQHEVQYPRRSTKQKFTII